MSLQEELTDHVAAHGGLSIFMCSALRLALSIGLLAFSIYAAIQAPGPEERASPLERGAAYDMDTLRKWKHGKGRKKHQGHHNGEKWFSEAEWIEIAVCTFYVSHLELPTRFRNFEPSMIDICDIPCAVHYCIKAKKGFQNCLQAPHHPPAIRVWCVCLAEPVSTGHRQPHSARRCRRVVDMDSVWSSNRGWLCITSGRPK